MSYNDDSRRQEEQRRDDQRREDQRRADQQRQEDQRREQQRRDDQRRDDERRAEHRRTEERRQQEDQRRRDDVAAQAKRDADTVHYNRKDAERKAHYDRKDESRLLEDKEHAHRRYLQVVNERSREKDAVGDARADRRAAVQRVDINAGLETSVRPSSTQDRQQKERQPRTFLHSREDARIPSEPRPTTHKAAYSGSVTRRIANANFQTTSFGKSAPAPVRKMRALFIIILAACSAYAVYAYMN
jgi:hypothetical protein